MHDAPSVSYPVGRSRIAGWLLFLLWTSGASCAAAGCIRLGVPDWRSGLLAFGVLVAGAAAWAGSSRRMPAQLDFKGGCWSIGGAAGLQAAEARVALDGQSWLLLRLGASGHTARWIWLERRSMPQRWQDLRRAVYSRPVPASQASTADRSALSSAQHPLS